jgi:hypothetical protein
MSLKEYAYSLFYKAIKNGIITESKTQKLLANKNKVSNKSKKLSIKNKINYSTNIYIKKLIKQLR